jgi:hypothetical protein
MGTVLAALAVSLLLTGVPAAFAQDDVNASLGPDVGGTGIGPNGAGFDGALGDPVFLAENPGLYPPATGVTGVRQNGVPAGQMAVPAPPGTYGQPPRGPFQYYYAPR